MELWLDFLKESAKEGNEKRLKELKGRSEIMETAINQLMEISADEKMRELYRSREKARLDMISKLKYAENRGMEKGMEKGIEKGIEKGMEVVARNLLQEGTEIEFVTKVTKLSRDKVEEIKKK
ncbi:MAG: PD-(D/E)XK nuclease family transposase, partial [Alkaliphilus sp.]|nr:PD-(D/E)XK nuclease family transposase [Alkaliphilus sp.]